MNKVLKCVFIIVLFLTGWLAEFAQAACLNPNPNASLKVVTDFGGYLAYANVSTGLWQIGVGGESGQTSPAGRQSVEQGINQNEDFLSDAGTSITVSAIAGDTAGIINDTVIAANGLPQAPHDTLNPPPQSPSGTWTGSSKVTNPFPCTGISGTWTAVLIDTSGVLSGTWQGSRGSSGTLSGTFDGTTATWSTSGGGPGIIFSATIGGTSIQGGFSSSQHCIDSNGGDMGPMSGVFWGSKQ